MYGPHGWVKYNLNGRQSNEYTRFQDHPLIGCPTHINSMDTETDCIPGKVTSPVLPTLQRFNALVESTTEDALPDKCGVNDTTQERELKLTVSLER